MSQIFCKGYPDGNPFVNLSATTLTVTGQSRLNGVTATTVYLDHIDFNTGHTSESHLPGRLEWNAVDGTLNLGMIGGDVSLQIGQENLMYVENHTNRNFFNGQVVYINGAHGDRSTIDLANAGSSATSRVIGMLTENIPSGNTMGYITTFGIVRDVDTHGLGEGAILYLATGSTSGAVTTIKPNSPNFCVKVGCVIRDHPVSGMVLIHPDVAYSLSDLADVDGTPPSSTNKYLVWNDTNKYWDPNQIYFSGVTNTGHTHEYSSILNTGHTHAYLTESLLTGTLHTVISAGTFYGMLESASAYTVVTDTLNVYPTRVSVSSSTLNTDSAYGTDYNSGYSFNDYYSYTANNSTTFLSNVHFSFNSDMYISGQNATFSSPYLYAYRSFINANGAVKIQNSPLEFTMVNPAVGQAWSNGYMLIDVYGNASQTMVAAVTKMRGTGSGGAIGYQGYAISSSSAHTGAIVGVNGYAAMSSNANNSYGAAFEANVITIGSSQTPTSKRMGLKSNAHVLINSSSLIVATGTSVSPDALSAQTGHLNFYSGGQLYVQGMSEFDNEVFFDHNESSSLTAVTGTYTASSRTIILASGTFTVYLPAVSGKVGRKYTIKNKGTGTVTVDGNASETIDGSLTQSLLSMDSMQIVSDGTEWWVL